MFFSACVKFSKISSIFDPMKALIELENMEFRAFHGCFDLEKKVGSRFRVDVTVEAEIGDAAAHDSLKGTINYAAVYKVVQAQMTTPSDIIENVALRIIDAIKKEFPEALRVTAKVAKIAPPIAGKVGQVSVSLTK